MDRSIPFTGETRRRRVVRRFSDETGARSLSLEQIREALPEPGWVKTSRGRRLGLSAVGIPTIESGTCEFFTELSRERGRPR